MNYLCPSEDKTTEEEIFDLDILENLSEEYDLTVEELKKLSSKQISDLIDTWDYNFSHNIEKEILDSLKK